MGRRVSAARGRGHTWRAVAPAIEAIERRILFAALDPTWAGDGIELEPYPTQSPQHSAVLAIAVLAGDKVLALAEHFDLTAHDPSPTHTLVRYNADGSVDTTFGGGDGIVPVAGMARDMVVAADGTIYLSMSDPGAFGGRSLGVARYLEARNSDGSLKTTFAGDGRYDFTYAGDPGSARELCIALAPDGDLFAATASATRGGTEETPTFAEHTKVVKLNPDGTGDSAFDGDGVLTYTPDDGHPDVGDIVVQPTGHLVMLSTSDFQFTRIAPGSAVQEVYRPFPGIYPQQIAVQPDGKILAVESTSFSLPPYYLSVGRLNADLTLDTSYGTDGVARGPDTNNGTTKIISAFGVDNEGRAVAVANYVDEHSLLMRFTPDGSFDTSVAPGVGLPLDIFGAHALAFTPDGKYVIGSRVRGVAGEQRD